MRGRVTVEFIGGPADGTLQKVPTAAAGHGPVPERIWRHHTSGEGGAPLAVTEYLYRLQPAPEGGTTEWQYVLDQAGTAG